MSALRLRLVVRGYPWNLFSAAAQQDSDTLGQYGKALWDDVCDIVSASQGASPSASDAAVNGVGVCAPAGCAEGCTQFDLHLSFATPQSFSAAERALVASLYHADRGTAPPQLTLPRLTHALQARFGASFGSAALDAAASLIRVQQPTAAAPTTSSSPPRAASPSPLQPRYPAAAAVAPAPLQPAAAAVPLPRRLPDAAALPVSPAPQRVVAMPAPPSILAPPRQPDPPVQLQPGPGATVQELKEALRCQAELLRFQGANGGVLCPTTLLKEKLSLERLCEQLKRENAGLRAERDEAEAKHADLLQQMSSVTSAVGGVQLGGSRDPEAASAPPRGGFVVRPVHRPPPPPQGGWGGVAEGVAAGGGGGGSGEEFRKMSELAELRRMRQDQERRAAAAGRGAAGGVAPPPREGGVPAAGGQQQQQQGARGGGVQPLRMSLSTPARKGGAVRPARPRVPSVSSRSTPAAGGAAAAGYRKPGLRVP